MDFTESHTRYAKQRQSIKRRNYTEELHDTHQPLIVHNLHGY